MATVVTVHGTFAHAGSVPETPEGSPAEPQWWQQDGTLHEELRDFVAAQDGGLAVTSFEWSGDNSEVGRRDAGALHPLQRAGEIQGPSGDGERA